MVTKRLIVRQPLLAHAAEVLNDEHCRLKMRDFEDQGGFLSLRNDQERRFFDEFELARDMMAGRCLDQAKQIRYQVTRQQGLYAYTYLREPW